MPDVQWQGQTDARFVMKHLSVFGGERNKRFELSLVDCVYLAITIYSRLLRTFRCNLIVNDHIEAAHKTCLKLACLS